MDHHPPEFEIGRQLADAVEADEAHRRRHGFSPSPLEGIRYDVWRGEQDLFRFAASDVDRVVAGFIESYSHMGRDARLRARDAMSLDDFYTLISYARRSVVRGLREDGAGAARTGLRAVAAIDAGRVDARDVIATLGLLTWALRHAGDHDAVREARRLAARNTAELMARFVDPSPGDAELATWGHGLVSIAGEPALVEVGLESFSPQMPLVELAAGIAEVIDADDYKVWSVRAGARLPTVWLPGMSSADEGRALLDRCRGCVVVGARMRPGHADATAQQLTGFLVEAENRQDASTLTRWVQPADHAVLAVARVVTAFVLVARSYVGGVAGIETSRSLARFGPPVGDVLGGAGAAAT